MNDWRLTAADCIPIIAGMTQAAVIALVSIVAKRASMGPLAMRIIRSRRGPWRAR